MKTFLWNLNYLETRSPSLTLTARLKPKLWSQQGTFAKRFSNSPHIVRHSYLLGKRESAERPSPSSVRNVASAAQSSLQPAEDESETLDNVEPIARFSQLKDRGLVSSKIIETINTKMGIDDMTQVQRMTIQECLKGADTVAQARTGTGKTLAFLLPILQSIIKHEPRLQEHPRFSNLRNRSSIRALIISPTRELAEQIADEARKLTQDTNIIVRTAVGGSSKRFGLQQIRKGCNILVGTPGRLCDILSDPSSGVNASELSAFVLDEADRLLEQGFEKEIKAIQRYLPDRRHVDRQTMLFSATIPKEILPIVKATMRKDFQFIKTIQEGEQPTHETVPQKLVNIGGLDKQLPCLLELCLREIVGSDTSRPFKAIVFFPTLNEVILAADIFRGFRSRARSEASNLSSTSIFELHSKLSQRERSSTADAFKKSKSAILLSSDVAARGMDFPNVTHVIQVGLPPSQEQYIHRIGRTARAGKSGEAWLLVSDLERKEAHARLGRLPLQNDKSLQMPLVNLADKTSLTEDMHKLYEIFKHCIIAIDTEKRRQVYDGTFGSFQWLPAKQRLVNAANARASNALFLEEPSISFPRASKMGLLGLSGLKVEDRRDRNPIRSPRQDRMPPARRSEGKRRFAGKRLS